MASRKPKERQRTFRIVTRDRHGPHSLVAVLGFAPTWTVLPEKNAQIGLLQASFRSAKAQWQPAGLGDNAEGHAQPHNSPSLRACLPLLLGQYLKEDQESLRQLQGAPVDRRREHLIILTPDAATRAARAGSTPPLAAVDRALRHPLAASAQSYNAMLAACYN